MADEINTIDVFRDSIDVYELSTEAVQVIEQGPQGPPGTGGGGGGSGTVTSVALAGTGLSISGSPVTTSGTITANVSFGTTAGTSTEGNDARIATIGSGTITTNDGGGYINTSGGGSNGGFINTQGGNENGGNIDTSCRGTEPGGNIYTYSEGNNIGAGGNILAYGGSSGDSGSLDISNGGGSIDTRGTGSLELGVTGTRTTLVGSAATTDKTITLPNATGTVALTSQATDIEITDPTKGYILNSATKRWRITIDDNGVLLRTALALIFSLSFMCGSHAQVRDLVYGTNNVVVGPTNTNALTFTNRVTLPIASGAATTNSLLTADGSGSSAFVSTLPKLTIASGTITNSNPALTISQTWSNTNVAFTGLLVNITNTASSTNSLMADFQTNGTSQFKIDRTGNVTVPTSSGYTAGIGRWYDNGGGGFVASLSGSDKIRMLGSPDYFILSSTTELTWGSSGVSTIDLRLTREAAGTIAQRNTTNSQAYNLYNTYSNSTNYERGKIAWTNNVLTIGTEKGTGGGTARALQLQTDGTARFTLTSGGGLMIGDGSAQANNFFGWSGNGGFRAQQTSTGVITLFNWNEDGFNRLQFGGTTTNFPALKRTNTILQVRLADDSAYTTIDAQHRLQGTAPTNSTDTGTAGDIRYDATNLYVCTASNTWNTFSSNRITVSGLTTNVVRTSWANVGADKTNNDTGLSLSYDANTLYKLRWVLYVGSTWSNIAYGLAFGATNSYNVRSIHTTINNSQPTGINMPAGLTYYTLATETGSSVGLTPWMVWGESVWMPTNSGTVNLRFWTSSSNTGTSTLFSNSIITLEKLYP